MTSAGPKHVDRALTAAGETVDEIASESPTGQDLPHGWSWTPGSVQSGGQAHVRPTGFADANTSALEPPSARGAWIETIPETKTFHAPPMSPSARGAWIETGRRPRPYPAKQVSPSVRGRGLKRGHNGERRIDHCVALRRGGRRARWEITVLTACQ